MSKYSIQCTITSVSINKSQIKKLESYVANHVSKKSSNLNIDLIQPVIIKESEFSILNDRLLIVALISTVNNLTDTECESLKSELGNSVGEYLSNQNIIYETNLVSLFKL